MGASQLVRTGVDLSGKITATADGGDKIGAFLVYLAKPPGETISYTVTANGGKYFIDGEQQKALTFEVGNTYEFDLSAVQGAHPFFLSSENDGKWGAGTPYTEGVTTVGNKLIIEVTESTPDLFYYCNLHPQMGASASVTELSLASYLQNRGIIEIDGETVKPLVGLLDDGGNRIGQFVADVENDKFFFATQTEKNAQEDFVASFSFPDNFSTNAQPFHVKISAMSVGGGGTEAEYVDGNIDLLPTMKITVTAVNDPPNISLGTLSLGEGEAKIFTTDVIDVSDVEGDSLSIKFGGNPVDFTTSLLSEAGNSFIIELFEGDAVGSAKFSAVQQAFLNTNDISSLQQVMGDLNIERTRYRLKVENESGTYQYYLLDDLGELVPDNQWGALQKPLMFVNKNALETLARQNDLIEDNESWQDLTELERNNLISENGLDTVDLIPFEAIRNKEILIVHTGNEIQSDKIDFMVSDGQSEQTGYLNFSVTLINDTPQASIVSEITGFANDTELSQDEIDDFGNPLPIHAIRAFPEDSLTFSDNDNVFLVSATVRLTNPQNGDFLYVSQNMKLSDGLTASDYNPETGELTVTGKATPQKYAQEMSKILFFNSSDAPVVGNRTFEISVNDGRDEGVSEAVTHTLYLSYAKTVAADLNSDGQYLLDSNGQRTLKVDESGSVIPLVAQLLSSSADDYQNLSNDNLSVDGWKGDDVIKTGSGTDEIYGGEGNDQIDSGSGNDTIFGQEGNDSIYGGSGDDVIYGQEGNDLIYAGAGFDILSGGDGIDTASFELLTSAIRADLAFGEIYTNENTDSIYEIINFVIVEFDEAKTYNFELLIGTNYDDVIIAADHTAMEYIGGDGDDEIFGGAQDEVLDGGLGSDTLFGGAGQDVLKGGEGSDVFGLTGEDQGLDIIKDFSTGDIVDLTRLGIGSKDELSFKEGTLTVNDYTYSGTILSRVDPQELSETALFLFENEDHDAFTTNNPLEHVII